MKNRDGDAMWPDLCGFYPPSEQHPNTVFKSMAIVFQALGGTISYVDFMGVSAPVAKKPTRSQMAYAG